jgi:hypothetical protein
MTARSRASHPPADARSDGPPFTSVCPYAREGRSPSPSGSSDSSPGRKSGDGMWHGHAVAAPADGAVEGVGLLSNFSQTVAGTPHRTNHPTKQPSNLTSKKP